jgi:hypothetical protein
LRRPLLVEVGERRRLVGALVLVLGMGIPLR